MFEELFYWVWLSAITCMAPRKKNQLLEVFSAPVNLWHASRKELEKLSFLNTEAVWGILDKSTREKTHGHLENIYKDNIKVIPIADEKYPRYLKNIYDPPIVLYMKGTLEQEETSIAVVGSRAATPYGLSMAERLGCDLAGFGITVVSGMARGIDTGAHRGALKAKGRTLAVLGCGLDRPYPPENKDLMESIAQSGAVLSEFIPGTPPIPMNFPIRNRIISGLTVGTVVIEANEKSGSLITADLALQQGREVFAVPGNITSAVSRGTNKLIKEGAKIVTSVADIFEELNFYKSTYNTNNTGIQGISCENILKGLDGDERILVKLMGNDCLHIDRLMNTSGFSVQRVNSLLVMLELKGVVEQLPGKMYKIKL